MGQDYGSGLPQLDASPPAAAAATAQVLMGVNENALSTTVTLYVSILGNFNSTSGLQTTVGAAESIVNTAGVLSDFRVEIAGALSSGSHLVTLMLNGSATTISCTITSVFCTDADTVAIVAGDEIAIEFNPDTPNNARVARWVINFTPTTADQFMLFSHSSTDSDATNFLPVNGENLAAEADEDPPAGVICEAGTISNLFCEYDSALAAGDARTYTVQIDQDPINSTFVDSSPLLDCDIDGDDAGPDNISCSDTSDSFAVTAGDRIVIEQIEDSGTPSDQRVACSMRFVPTTANHFMVMGSLGGTTNDTSSQQAPLTAGDGFFASDTNTKFRNLANPMTIHNIHVATGAAPGTSPNAFNWQLENTTQSTTDPNCATTGTTAPAACNNTETHGVNDNDLLVIRFTPVSTPTNTFGTNWCFGATVP